MSVRSRALRLSVAAGTVVAAAVPMIVFGAAGSAQAADQLCESVVITGTVAGHWASQPCFPYSGNPICGIHEDIGNTAVDVVIDLCIP